MQKSLVYREKFLAYEVTGNGMPVMLVHGFTEDRSIWQDLLAGMEGKYRWILPDLPGSGASDFNPALTTLTDFAEALSAILLAEQISEILLIGHSMGGYISLAFAEKYPDRIRGLGLFHSSSYADDAEKKTAREKNIAFIKKNGPALFTAQSIPGLYSDRFKMENPGEIQKWVDRYANFNPESLVSYLEAMKQRPATTQVLETITKPVLFIMGENDKAVPLQDALEQSHLPRISYIHILTRTAHMGMIENTSLCSSIVDRFLNDFHY